MNRIQYQRQARLNRISLRHEEPRKVVACEDINFQIGEDGRLTADRCYYRDSRYRSPLDLRVPGLLASILLASSYTSERSKELRRGVLKSVRELRTPPCTMVRVPIPG